MDSELHSDQSATFEPHVPAEFAHLRRVEETRIPCCPVCDATRYHPFSEGFDYELQTCSNRWRFVICDECQHVWLLSRPAVSELLTVYPPHYYAYNFEAQVNRIAQFGKSIIDARKIGSILSRLPTRMSSFLDIGCGTGRYLRSAHKFGCAKDRIFGLELDERAVTALREEGFQAFAERVEETHRIPNGSIDLAIMFHVIEHVDNPSAVLERIREWLSPAGLLVLETPNVNSVDARMFSESYWGGYHFPRHWNLFCERSISRILNRSGFRVIDISYQTGHSFWMYSFHHLLRFGATKSPRLAKLFNPLTGLPLLALFTAFDLVRSRIGFKTSAMLVTAARE